MPKEKDSKSFSRYEQIAADLAMRIMKGEHQKGEMLYGRSTLAGRYKVSPETIRRAIALLEEEGVVSTIAGAGIMVKSPKAAERYLSEVEHQKTLGELQARLDNLIAEKRRLDAEIEQTVYDMSTFIQGMINNLQYLEKIEVPPDSVIVGASLASLELRSKTGATVVGVERNDEVIYSPPSTLVFQAGDVLHFVGTMESKAKVREIVRRKA